MRNKRDADVVLSIMDWRPLVMTCEQTQELLHAYVDGELDLSRTMEIEGHLGGCETCHSEHQDQLHLRRLVQAGAQYFTAPDTLRKRIESANTAERTVGAALRGRPYAKLIRFRKATESSSANTIQSQGRPRSAAPTVRSEALYPQRWLAAAALVILTLCGLLLWMIVSGRSQSRTDNLLAQEIVSSHIRSMMLDHLVDVPSSDQHTVKPWFNGKLDFAPEVKDLADQGFPLLGGRLDYIDNRTAAALVYQRRKHSINLFIWSSPGVTDQLPQHFSVNGYNLIHWNRSGASYWAVSDVNSTDLSEFAQLVSR